MRVAIEELEQIQSRLAEINAMPLEQIEWVKNGEVLSFSDEDIQHWKFIGLTNMHFPFMIKGINDDSH